MWTSWGRESGNVLYNSKWNLYITYVIMLWDMEQWTGSKLGNECIKAINCHPAFLTHMQSTSCEMPGWMNHKLETRFLGEISTTSDI